MSHGSDCPHHCHALGCQAPCPPEHLMCPEHWRMVPALYQGHIWEHYRPGQCEDRRPSREWLVAAKKAIYYVAFIEGKLTADEISRRYEKLARKVRRLAEAGS